MAQAKAAFADGLTSPDSIQLKNVTEATLGAMPVCQGIIEIAGQGQMVIWTNNTDGSITQFQQDDQGNITTSNLTPNGAQSALQSIQALGEAESNQFDQGQAPQQKQQDQQAFYELQQNYYRDEPQCKQIEQHPVSSALLGILVGNGLNDAIKGTSSGLTLSKCQQLESIYNQAVQIAQQEGLTTNTDDSQGNNQ